MLKQIIKWFSRLIIALGWISLLIMSGLNIAKDTGYAWWICTLALLIFIIMIIFLIFFGFFND